MNKMSQEEKDSAVYVLPAGYSETEFELSEDELAFNAFKDEALDNENYSKITVSRVPMNRHGQRGSQKLHFLFECAVDEYTYSQLLSKLRDEYKSGFYKIQARNEKGQLKLNKTVAVEAPHIDTDTASGDGGTGAIIEQFSRSLTEQSAEMRDMIQSMMPASNPMASMKDMFETMGAMMGAMGIHTQQPKSMLDQLTEFKMLQELMTSGNSGSGEGNLMSLLTETVKSFGPALGMAIAAQTESGAIPAKGPVLAQLDKPTEKEPIVETTLNAELEAMRPQIDFLVSQAKAGAKAEDVATAIMPGIPDNALESIEAFLKKDDCIDLCISVNAEIQNHRLWFIDWRDAMLKKIDALFEPDDPKPTVEIISGLTALDSVAQTDEAIAGSDTITDEPTLDESGTDQSDLVASEADASASTENQDHSDSDGSASGDAGDESDP